MKTTLPKVAHTILGRPLVLWAADSLVASGVSDLVFVISPGQPITEAILAKPDFPREVTTHTTYQPEPLGTGNAATAGMNIVSKLLTERQWSPDTVEVIIGFGDTPAVSANAFERFRAARKKSGHPIAILAFTAKNPTGYGRVLTTRQGDFIAIREDKDCTEDERDVHLCNSGFLCAQADLLQKFLPLLTRHNAAGEYYLTDIPKLARDHGMGVAIFSDVDEEELAGINSQMQLATVTRYVQQRLIASWQENGVHFMNPDTVYLEPTVEFGSDCVIEPFVSLAGKTTLPSGTRVTSFTRYQDGIKL